MLEKTTPLSSLPKSPGGFVYRRHKPEETDLYKIIEQNLPSFQSHLSNADVSLPAFVHNEFCSYLRCGLLKHGFLRVKCNDCRCEHLTWAAAYIFMQTSRLLSGAPSPSCGARRMVETSSHLIDRNAEPQSFQECQYDSGYLVSLGRYGCFLLVNPTRLADASLSLFAP